MKITADKRAIDKIFRRRDRYEIPDWQRQKVWSREKKQNLIDSILRGWKLPKFYFLKQSEDQFEVIDGQQRLGAIWDFFANELVLSDSSAVSFGGRSYKDLPSNVSDKFDDFEIEFDLIEEAGEKELKEFFQRLQQGLPLTSSEKLNSVHSKLRDFCKDAAGHSFFKNKVSASDKRYGHFDILSKVVAIELDGIDTSLRYDKLKSFFESQQAFSSSSNTAKRIRAALTYLDRVFRHEADSRLRIRTVVQSFITLTCEILRSGNANGLEARLEKFFQHFGSELSAQVEKGPNATDMDYLAFQRTVNANVKSGPRTRHQILLRKLLAFDPSFVSALGAPALVKSSIDQTIRTCAEEVADLITTLNKLHQAKHGDNVFKITNDTTAAIRSLGKPIASYDEYKNLIDHMYFLFHEGAKGKLPSPRPQSFADVNLLRTDLRHDLDHGKAKDISAKRGKIREAFKRYISGSSAAGLDPSLFPLFHANLLSQIRQDLHGLRVTLV